MVDTRVPFVLDGKPVVDFQPAVDLATGRILGFEALLHWDHPTQGRISPGVLIPWAEANNQILAINAWVLAEACRQAQGWPSGIQLAVNCSIIELRQGQGSVAVAAALRESGLNPDRLTVEVTESSVADDRAAVDLRALGRLGIHLTVEDVGTSWSTLENLRRFAFETAKADKRFISNLERDQGMNLAIVEAIVNICRSMAMSTVAEGVENARQLAMVRGLGVDVAQGYFFSAPMTGDEARELANADPRHAYELPAPLAVSVGTDGARPLTVLADASPVGVPRDVVPSARPPAQAS